MSTRQQIGMTPAAIVDRQLDAYHRHDIDAFATCYTDDVVLGPLNGAVQSVGLAALRTRYRTLFQLYPKNRARVVNRMVLGSVVIDHEDIDRGPGAEKFQTLVIYTLAGDKIARVDFVRA